MDWWFRNHANGHNFGLEFLPCHKLWIREIPCAYRAVVSCNRRIGVLRVMAFDI